MTMQQVPPQQSILGEKTVRRLQALPNPYVGPRPFTTAERNLFFGREQEANQLIPLIIAEHLVLFYAQSGAGKSSLINARLVPGLVDRNFKVLTGRVSGQTDESAQADNIFIYNLLLSFERSEHGGEGHVPDAKRLAHMTLADYLADLDIEAPPEGGVQSSIAGSLEPSGETPLEQPQKLLIDAPQTIGGVQPLALIIDQFEEIFTTNPGAWNQRAPFFQQISAALESDPYLWVVFSIREDYIASLDPYAELLPGKLRARFYMQRMGYAAALEAVCNPVEKMRPFEDSATEELVRSLSLINIGKDQNNNPVYKQGQFIEPVQLQVVCYQLFEELRNRPGRNITIDDLVALAKGKDLAQFIGTALGNYYVQSLHEVMKQYPDIRERRLRDWFSHELITETESRSSVRQGKESTGAPPNDLPNAVVRTLQDRFIVRTEIRGENTWYELSHDRFVAPILQSNREWYDKNARPVEIAALAWFEAGQDSARLYDGRQLQSVVALLRDNPDDFSEREKKFIEASQAAASKREKQRQNMVIIFFSLLLLILSTLTFFSLQQSRMARESAAAANVQKVTADVASTQANLQRSTAVEASSLEAEQRHRAETASAMEAGLRQAAVSARVTAEAAKDLAEVASTQAVEERDSARKAEAAAQAARLSSLSDYFRDNNLDLSLLLAAQAEKMSGDWQAQRALLTSIQRAMDTRVSAVGFPWRVQAKPYSVAFSPDGSVVAVSSIGNIDLWNVSGEGRAAKVPDNFKSDAPMYSVSFDQTGNLLARGGGDGEVRIWNRTDDSVSVFKPFRKDQKYSSVLFVAFQPGGDLLAVGTERDPLTRKGLLFIYNYKTGNVVGTGDCDVFGCSALDWSPDGKRLAVGSKGGVIQILDSARFSTVMEVQRAHTGEITGLAWYPDGQRLISGGIDQRLILWDVAAQKILRQTNNRNTPIIISLAVSPDRRFLVVGVNDKNAWFGLWDAETLQKLDYHLQGHAQPVSAAAFHPQGSYFVTAGYDNAVILWKFEPVESLSRVVQNVGNPGVEGLLQGKDGKLNFARSVESVQVETITEGVEAPVVQNAQHAMLEMVSLDGQAVLALGSKDGQVSFVDPAAGSPVRDPIKVSGGALRSLAASADGKLLAAAACTSGQNCGKLVLWDLNGNKPVEASSDLKKIKFDSIASLAFSPDNRTLVIGNNSGKIIFYDLASGKVAQAVTEGIGQKNVTMVVTSLAFSPTRNMLAAGFQDGRIALWETSSLSPIGQFVERANGEVTGLLFRKNLQDGQEYLVSVSRQGEVREWTVDVKAWTARACQIAGRNLTAEEKAKFLLPGGAQSDVCPSVK